MEITLSHRDKEEIAYKVALILEKRLRNLQQPEMVTTKEAADILGIQPDRMRKIADRYPHIKKGDSKQGQLLFNRSALLQ